MKRQFSLTIHYGLRNSDYMEYRDKSETIEATSMIELVSKFTLLVAKLDREFYEEDIQELRDKLVGEVDDIPF